MPEKSELLLYIFTMQKNENLDSFIMSLDQIGRPNMRQIWQMDMLV